MKKLVKLISKSKIAEESMGFCFETVEFERN